MHPQARQTERGFCPICGMGLECDPSSAGDDAPNPELVDFTRRMWVGVVVTVPLLLLTMGPMIGLGFIREAFAERNNMWIELALGTLVVLWCGMLFLKRGWVSFVTWKLNIFSLIAMGVMAACSERASFAKRKDMRVLGAMRNLEVN
jgi:P-type Cu+ transporter